MKTTTAQDKPKSDEILPSSIATDALLLKDLVAQYHLHRQREQEIAQAVFNNIARYSCLNDKRIKHWLSLNSVFNGEIILAARNPADDIIALSSDFSGNGICATIATLPVSEIFYRLVEKGYPLTHILSEINKKLHLLLPRDLLCRACVIAVNSSKGYIEIWSSGFPSCLLLSEDGTYRFVASQSNLPLGVVDENNFKPSIQIEKTKVGDRLFIFSNGINKIIKNDNSAFSLEGVKQLLQEKINSEDFFEQLLKVLNEHNDNQSAQPFTLLEVKVELPEISQDNKHTNPLLVTTRCMRDWHFSLELHSQTLRHFDPLPLLLHILMESPELQAHKGVLYTILAELYSNALDHGVLKLDSALKRDTAGFTGYYQQREKLLENLEEGFVRFNIKHTSTKTGGELLIEVVDSGNGFDYSHLLQTDRPNQTYAGRGITLIRNLCKKFEYLAHGNHVRVLYCWEYEDE